MPPNLKLLSSRNLHEIEPFKRYMKATTGYRFRDTAGQVDQLWTEGECCSHPQHILGKVKTSGQGCGFCAPSGGSLRCQLKPRDSHPTVGGWLEMNSFIIQMMNKIYIIPVNHPCSFIYRIRQNYVYLVKDIFWCRIFSFNNPSQEMV